MPKASHVSTGDYVSKGRNQMRPKSEFLPEVFGQHEIVPGFIELHVKDPLAVWRNPHSGSSHKWLFLPIGDGRDLLRVEIVELNGGPTLLRASEVDAVRRYSKVSPTTPRRIVDNFDFVTAIDRHAEYSR